MSLPSHRVTHTSMLRGGGKLARGGEGENQPAMGTLCRRRETAKRKGIGRVLFLYRFFCSRRGSSKYALMYVTVPACMSDRPAGRQMQGGGDSQASPIRDVLAVSGDGDPDPPNRKNASVPNRWHSGMKRRSPRINVVLHRYILVGRVPWPRGRSIFNDINMMVYTGPKYIA